MSDGFRKALNSYQASNRMGGSCRLGQYWLGYSRTSKKIEVAEEVKSGNWCGNDRRERESERDRKNVRERVEKKKGNLDINGCHLSVGGCQCM